MSSGRQPPRVLLLAMYALDRGTWGATTRITQLRDELETMSRLEVISGTRGRRSLAIARYLATGRMRGLRGMYVESSTSLPGPVDLALMGLARAAGIPVLTYLRDAQQLFGEYYAADTPKRRLSRAAFLPMTRALISTSTRVAFPSRGLAAAILGATRARQALLLPPGARVGPLVPLDPSARGLLFVGSLRYPAHGGEILMQAMQRAADAGSGAELVWVAPRDESPPSTLPAWLRIERAQGAEIDRLLPSIRVSVTPRRATPYNDLAVPIKVLEYLGYGRPLLVTDTEETTRIVRDAGAGLVVEDNVDGLSHGIIALMAATPGQLHAWGTAARAAAERNSWRKRAEEIMQLLELPVSRR